MRKQERGSPHAGTNSGIPKLKFSAYLFSPGRPMLPGTCRVLLVARYVVDTGPCVFFVMTSKTSVTILAYPANVIRNHNESHGNRPLTAIAQKNVVLLTLHSSSRPFCRLSRWGGSASIESAELQSAHATSSFDRNCSCFGGLESLASPELGCISTLTDRSEPSHCTCNGHASGVVGRCCHMHDAIHSQRALSRVVPTLPVNRRSGISMTRTLA